MVGSDENESNDQIEPAEIYLGELTLGGDEPTLRDAKIDSTRERLAYYLLALLAGVLLYMLLLLTFGRISTDDFVTILGVLLAPLIGLVAAATGYYYGRSSR